MTKKGAEFSENIDFESGRDLGTVKKSEMDPVERQLLREVGRVLDVMDRNGIADGATLAKIKGVFSPGRESATHPTDVKVAIPDKLVESTLRQVRGSKRTSVVDRSDILRLVVGAMHMDNATNRTFGRQLQTAINIGTAAYDAKKQSFAGAESSTVQHPTRRGRTGSHEGHTIRNGRGVVVYVR
jgi:hypothetical protein